MCTRLQDCLSPNCLLSRHCMRCSSPSCTRIVASSVRNHMEGNSIYCSACIMREGSLETNDMRLGKALDGDSSRRMTLASPGKREKIPEGFQNIQAIHTSDSVIKNRNTSSTEPMVYVQTPIPPFSPVNCQPMVYQNLLLFIVAEVSSKGPGRDQRLRETLQGYLDSTAALDVMSSLLHSHEYFFKLSQISSYIGSSSDPRVHEARRRDEEEIANLLAYMLHSDTEMKFALYLEGENTQRLLDVVQDILDKGFLKNPEGCMARQLLVILSETYDLLPSSLLIKGVSNRDKEAISGGAFADVYRASYNGEVVALKRLRIFQKGSDLHKIRRKFCQEALLWHNLRHPYVLPFLGIDSKSFASFPCMVSPWMGHGTILKYLAENGKANVDQRLLEVAQGLAYLHFQNVVHGDLCGSNILINDKWHACLADFGLTVFADATVVAPSSSYGGSLRWMAPELHWPQVMGLDRFQRTFASDVYAFACVCLELYTGCPPFEDISPDAPVIIKVVNGERPERPSGEHSMADDMWNLVELCWSQTIANRPTIQQVTSFMEQRDKGAKGLLPAS